MNIIHQIRTGGDPDMEDIYVEVPWLEFIERPGQPHEELLERWKALPQDKPRAFKTHTGPGPMMDFHKNVKYFVLVRNPEEAMVSFKPFLEQHSQALWDLWDPEGHIKGSMVQPDWSFPKWFNEVALKFKMGPPDSPDIPGGMLNMFFSSFINSWWPLRNEKNVLMMHFNDLKSDHEGSIRKIADFLGFHPTEEQWPKILEYTGFKWMKEHQEKFEIHKLLPFVLLNPGAMVRKGAVGKAAEDGMTPEVQDTIQKTLSELVTDKDALKWFYKGGPHTTVSEEL